MDKTELEEGEIEDESRPPPHHEVRTEDFQDTNEPPGLGIQDGRQFWTDEKISSFDYHHGLDFNADVPQRSERRMNFSGGREMSGPFPTQLFGNFKHRFPVPYQRNNFHHMRTHDYPRKRQRRIPEKHGYAYRPYFDVNRRNIPNNTSGRVPHLPSRSSKYRNDDLHSYDNYLMPPKPSFDRSQSYRGQEAWRGKGYRSKDPQFDNNISKEIDAKRPPIVANEEKDQFRNTLQHLLKDSKNDVKSSPEKLSNNSISSTKNANSKESDEYVLDDFELLLERHRLIQQHLSVIGRQERNMKERFSNNHNVDDMNDFKIIPNPNDFTYDDFSDFSQNLSSTSEPSRDKSLETKSDGILREVMGRELSSPQETNSTPKDHLSEKENFENRDIRIVSVNQREGSDKTRDHNKDVSEVPETDERIVMQAHKEEVIQKSVPRKNKKRKRVKMARKLKNTNPNLTELPRHKVRVSVDKSKNLASVKKNQLIESELPEENANNDNYEAVAMELDEEDENAEKLDESSIKEEKKSEISEQEPVNDRVDKEYAEVVAQDVLAEEGSDAKVEKAAHTVDDNEDDLLLREQLLQSLARKRAEKARAMIAEQLKEPSVSPASQSPVRSETIKKTTATSFALPTLSKVNSLSDIYKSTKSPTLDSSSSQQCEKVIIQIGNETDSDDEEVESETEAASDFFTGAINDLLREARHGTKAPAIQAKTETSTPQHSANEAVNTSNESVGLISSLQECIEDAHQKLENHRADAKKDESTIKLLSKKISMRKSKIKQQTSKITKLRNLLEKIETSRKALTSQCATYEQQAKLLNQRIQLRVEKSSDLEEELLRARSILSTIKRRDSLMDSPKRMTVYSSPCDSGSSSYETEGSVKMNEQIRRSIQKMKVAIVRKSSELASSTSRSRLSSKRKSKTEKEEPTKKLKQNQQKNMLPNELGRSDLQYTKEKLQKLERELREKLERMKALSALKRRQKEVGKKETSSSVMNQSNSSPYHEANANLAKGSVVRNKSGKTVRRVYDKGEVGATNGLVGGNESLAKRNDPIELKNSPASDEADANKGVMRPNIYGASVNLGPLRSNDEGAGISRKIHQANYDNTDDRNSQDSAFPKLTRVVINENFKKDSELPGTSTDNFSNDAINQENIETRTDIDSFQSENERHMQGNDLYSSAVSFEEGERHDFEKEESRLQTLLQDEERIKRFQEKLHKKEVEIPMWDKFTTMHTMRSRKPQKLLDFGNKSTIKQDGSSYSKTRGKKQGNEFVQNYRNYSSPLLSFKSYRLCPYFRTREKKSMSSSTYSNNIKSRGAICPYDLTGKCLDENCKQQHVSKALSLTEDELLSDLVAYAPNMADITSKDSPAVVKEKIKRFIDGFHKQYKNKMSIDQLALLLVNKIKENKRETARGKNYHFNIVDMEKLSMSRNEDRGEKDDVVEVERRVWKFGKRKNIHYQDKAEKQEVRYFQENYDVKKLLESSVEADPSDVTSWVALAKKILSPQKMDDTQEYDVEEIENQALNVLSRALEANPTSEDLWFMYLDLFAKKDCHDDLRDLCMQAVEYCQSYPTWWKVLQFERIHENRLDLCLDMMEFLVRNPEESPEDVKSHQILETLLYMVQIEIFKDKIASAVGILRKVLLLPGEIESRNESQTQDYIPELYNEFLIGDLVILWICYISVAAFGHLPSFLFDPSDSRPSKIVSKRILMIDWRLREAESVGRVQEMFKDALLAVENHPSFTEENVSDFLPIFEHAAEFEISNGNSKNGLAIVKKLSESMTQSKQVRLLRLKSTIRLGNIPEVILYAESDEGSYLESYEYVYEYARWLASMGKNKHAEEILSEAAIKKFRPKADDRNTGAASVKHQRALDSCLCYKRLLNISTELVADIPTLPKEEVVSSKDREHAFIWLDYCLLLDIRSTRSELNKFEVEEAYGAALSSYTPTENRRILWQECLHFSLKKIKSFPSEVKYLEDHLDLTHRCLVSIPSSVTLPYAKSECWNDFNFHNAIIRDCLAVLPESLLGSFLEKCLQIMPMNMELAVRACHHEIASGNLEQARNMYGFILKQCPYSLEMWKMAICVELKSNGIREARWLYEEATKMLPFSTDLWKDRIQFEIAYGSNMETIKKSLLEIYKHGKDCGMEIIDNLESLLQKNDH